MGQKNIFDDVSEVIAWIQIVLSLFFIASVLGFILYMYYKTDMALMGGISIAVLGLLIGIRRANKAYRGKGTVDLVSRVSATPELDEDEKKPF